MDYKELEKSKKEECKIEIYNLRKNGLNYREIVNELEKQGIKINYNTVRKRCKEIYALKGEIDPKEKSNNPNVNEEIYKLREQGLSITKIAEQLRKQGIEICESNIYKRCKKIYITKGKKQPRGYRIQVDNELIYNLREQGLTYARIEEEFKIQGININKETIKARCKKIYRSKGKSEPNIMENKKKANNELIFALRQQGLTYKEISEELKRQGIIISTTTVRTRCKEIYRSKGKSEQDIIENKVKANNELIFILREQGLSYRKIVKELEKQGIIISQLTVMTRCKEIYSLKGKNEPDLKNKQLNDEVLFVLREQGLTYKEISEELKKQGIVVSDVTVRRRCKKIYDLKGKNEPDSENRELNDELIFILREQGLSYRNIAKELENQGINMCEATVSIRCKRIYREKGEKEPKAKLDIKNSSKGKRVPNKINSYQSQELDKKIHELKEQGLSYGRVAKKLEENGIVITRQSAEQRHKKFLKSREQELAKEILNLTITRKATIEQIQQIANYYGVDLEGTMNSLIEVPRNNAINRQLDETIHELKEKGLSYQEISDEIKKDGKILTRAGIAARHKKFLKISEQELAKEILNLTITRKATMKQIQQIADYYGVDLEKTMNSLEEPTRSLDER